MESSIFLSSLLISYYLVDCELEVGSESLAFEPDVV